MELCLPHSLARPDVMGPLKASKTTNSASKSLSWQQQSPVSTDRIAAAHNAQMEATTAAMRADYDAKIAELMADLEGTRGEKEKTDTDLAILKASARKERLQCNKERTLLSRKVAEAEARAREASDGVASPEEFTTLQKALANGEATIQSLREALEVEETRRDKLQFEVACASTAEADVERLMVLVASLEKKLAEEREAKKCAEQEAEARSADARGLERRLKAAVEAAALAEHSAAKCIEDAGKITAEVHDARATQRHAELWLEKSLAEVDAVHALLAYERSVAAGAADTSMHVPHQFDRSMQTPLLQPPSPASDSADSHAAFAGMRPEMTEVVLGDRVGTGAQTPSPDSPTSMLAALAAAPSAGSIDGHAGGTTSAAAGAMVAPVAAHTTPTSRGRSQGSRSGLQTPELDGTRPILYSGTRLRTRMGGAGRGMGMDGDDEVPTTAAMRGGGGGEGGGGGRGGVGVFSPPTPTVLFGELAGDGGSTTTTWEKECTLGLEGPPRHSANGNATSGAMVAHARILVDSGSGNSAYCHGSTLGLEKPGRAMTMTTTTTAKKNEEVCGGGGGGEENTMAALLSLLRLETSKREEVQARATELEGAIAVVAQEAAAAVRRAESLAPPAHHFQRKKEEEEEAARTPSANGRGSEVCPCLHVHGSGATTASAAGSGGGGGGWGRTRQPQAGLRGAAPQPENLSPPDPHATFVRLDQDRQVAKILGLVREARTKLEVAADCGVGVNASGGRGRGGREKTQGKAARAGRGASFPTDETEINSWNGLNPTIEVASLIEQLEAELKRSVDDNAQLREFCTHLEGLLAAHGDRNDDGLAGAGAGGAGGGAGTTYGISAGAAVGGGCYGWGTSTAVGSNHPTGDGASPFSVRRGSFGERRKGAPLPGSFQDLC